MHNLIVESKNSDRIHHTFKIKFLGKVGMKEIHFNIKSISEKRTANTTLHVENQQRNILKF